MALTSTDFADIAARGLFIGQIAVATAQNKSVLLRSGFVSDASVRGAFATEAHTVQFPVFASNMVAADMPADGTAVADSYTNTLTFASENVATKLVPHRYMPNAVKRGVGGEVSYFTSVGQQIGYLMADSIESQLMTKAVTQATAESMVVDTYDAAKMTLGAITDAVTKKWAEHWDPANSLLVVSPKVYNDLLSDSDVLAAHKSSVKDLAGNPIPSLFGMGLVMSSKVAVNTSVYDNLIVRRDALQVYVAAGLNQFAETHIPGSGANQIDYTYAFATHVSRSAPCGVIVLQTL